MTSHTLDSKQVPCWYYTSIVLRSAIVFALIFSKSIQNAQFARFRFGKQPSKDKVPHYSSADLCDSYQKTHNESSLDFERPLVKLMKSKRQARTDEIQITSSNVKMDERLKDASLFLKAESTAEEAFC